jgi:NAD(P)-dependent dehydrogenase (short-subunit alcohol dehydrogenase family)
VTGGTSGLGRAMAHALAQAGARVAVTSRQRERAGTAAELGAGALGIELDVRDVSSVSAAVDSAYGMLGGLDVLVNNAGIGMRTVNPRFMTEPQPFWEVPPAGFRDVLETKVTGTFLVARAVVSRMLSAGGGRVITISMSEQTMTRRGFIPANLLDPAIVGPPIVWLASPEAAGVHDERIVARDFDDWLEAREQKSV